MQTQINPALAAAMTLERAAQAGEFQPVTPQGQPTVAAQLMQQAMPPSVPQVAQQAGLAGQIQAMQQQQAQQALMRQAMANRPPAGIEGLNPQMGNFAEGGIVGYAEAGKAEDKPITERYQRMGLLDALKAMYSDFSSILPNVPSAYVDTSERSQRLAMEREAARRAEEPEAPRVVRQAPSAREPMDELSEMALMTTTPSEAVPEPQESRPRAANLPQAASSLEGRSYPEVLSALERFSNVQAPGGGQAAQRPAAEPSAAPVRFTGAEAYRRKSEAELEKVLTEPPTPSQVGVSAGEFAGARKDFLRGQGLDPEYLQKELEASGKRAQERAAYADKLRAELEQRRSGVGAVPQGIVDFLLGARGIKGQGIGQVFTSGVGEMERAGAEARREGRQIQEMKFAYEDAATKERQLLESARHSIAMGDWNGAQARLAEAQRQGNAKQMARAELYRHFSTDVSREESERARLVSGERDRAEARKAREQAGLQTLLVSADDKVRSAVQNIEKTLQSKFPMAIVYNMNPAEAMKTDPEGFKAYLKERDDLYRRTVEPLERDRENIRNQLAGFSGWGNLTVAPSKK